MIIGLVRHTPDFSAATFEVEIGFLKVSINVAFVEEKSPCHCYKFICSTFATIFAVEESSVKCFSAKKELPTVFANAIQEFCLLKVAGILGAGPKIDDLFGFDLVVFEDCI